MSENEKGVDSDRSPRRRERNEKGESELVECSAAHAVPARATARLVRGRPACRQGQRELARGRNWGPPMTLFLRGGRRRRRRRRRLRRSPPRPHPSLSAACVALPFTPQQRACHRCDREKEETRRRARAAPRERPESDEAATPIARSQYGKRERKAISSSFSLWRALSAAARGRREREAAREARVRTILESLPFFVAGFGRKRGKEKKKVEREAKSIEFFFLSLSVSNLTLHRPYDADAAARRKRRAKNLSGEKQLALSSPGPTPSHHSRHCSLSASAHRIRAERARRSRVIAPCKSSRQSGGES